MLNVTDRCDRCGAQAFFAAFFQIQDDLGVLHFCAHHAREYMPALEKQAVEIFDGTEKLNTKPSVAAF